MLTRRLRRFSKDWDARDQANIDKKLIELDGTPTKKNLGANATAWLFLWQSRMRPRPRKICRCSDISADLKRECFQCQ